MATTALMSGLEFDALPYEEGRRCELLEGELIPTASPTLEHQTVVQNLQVALVAHFKAHRGQGRVWSDAEFALDRDYRVRPVVFVLLEDRLSSVDRHKIPIPGAPDIAVEVISPSERAAADTQAKLEAYLRHGTQEVWQVFPKSKSVVIHRGAASTLLATGEHITTPLLNGFSLDPATLFQNNE